MLIYKADNGETVIFSKGSAWHVQVDGMTNHYKAIDGPKVKLVDKVVYLSKQVKKVAITQNQYEIIKRTTNERQYVTFDFLSKNEMKLGTRSFYTNAGLNIRQKQEEKRKIREEKSQALADKKAAAIQKKADKRLRKEEKRAEKLARKNPDMFDE